MHIVRQIFSTFSVLYQTFSHSFFLLYSSLAVGTKSGYRLFSLSSVDNLEQIYENGKCEEYKIMHYSCQCFSVI
jgi:hypothetical protein